jgi:hypothetical protein
MAEYPGGTMVLSIDLELAWGSFDTIPVETLNAEAAAERKQIKRLLVLMDQYKIPATWAVVGHLMLKGCRRDSDGNAHAEIHPHARYSWFPHDWYVYDPCVDASKAPAWYASDIVEWIRETRTHHEIASHSFAHICYGDPECSSAAVLADLGAAMKVGSERGLALTSLVFPRNQVGYLELLRRVGLRAYRGVDPPHILSGSNVVLRKAVTALDALFGFIPTSVQADEVLPGLWNIPGSHCYLAHKGIYRLVPILSRVAKSRSGIKRAIMKGELYHLWFHPRDLIANPDLAFRCLEKIFSYAHGLREKGLLRILTMDEYARRLEIDKAKGGGMLVES